MSAFGVRRDAAHWITQGSAGMALPASEVVAWAPTACRFHEGSLDALHWRGEGDLVAVPGDCSLFMITSLIEGVAPTAAVREE
jgi:hypothetical protein